MRAIFVASAVTFTLLAVTHRASAVDKAACFSSSENGQRMRQAEKLQSARDQFLICSDKICPSVIKTDCIQWLSEVTAAIPTLTVSAQGRSGQDLIDVRVSIDGKQVTATLDGKGISVDPGVHTVRVETLGEAPKDQRVVVNVGEKARKISFRFGDEPTQTDKPRLPLLDEGHNFAAGHTTWPWALTGGGVVVVGVGLTLALTVSDQDKQIPASCKDNLTCSVAGDGQRASDASTAEARQRNGYIAVAVGGAMVLGGLLWHFLEPTGSPKEVSSRFRLRPSFGYKVAGVSGAF